MKTLKISHKSFCEQIKDLCHVLGYKVAWFRPAQTAKGWRTPVGGDGKGYLDLTIAKEGRLIFAEIKIPPDKPTPDQLEWIDLLKSTGKCEVYVWTPSDFDNILKILSEDPK